MNHQTSDPTQPPEHAMADVPAQEPSASRRDTGGQDLDPASIPVEEDEEARLPEPVDDSADLASEGTLAIGRAAIERAVRLAPTSPGVYRMLNAANDVL